MIVAPEDGGSEAVTSGEYAQVQSLTAVSMAACDDVDSPQAAVEDRVETAVRRCVLLLNTVNSELAPCFPARTGFDILHTGFATVKSRVREMIFWAAQDESKQWTFKGYVNLVKLVFELIESAGQLGVSADALQDLEADLQVRATQPLREAFRRFGLLLVAHPVTHVKLGSFHHSCDDLCLPRGWDELLSACRLSTLVLAIWRSSSSCCVSMEPP